MVPENQIQTKDKNIIVVGTGRQAKEVYSYVQDLAGQGMNISLTGFVDEIKPKGNHDGREVLGNFKDLKQFLQDNHLEEFHYITAMGDIPTRKRFVQEVEQLGCDNIKSWSLIHPNVYIGAGVEIKEGMFMAPGAVLTANIRIGRHCNLNVNTSVSHDCVIGDFVNLNPGVVICGSVHIGDDCFIGASATVIDEVTIGAGTTVGAGAVVTKDLPDHVTAVGVPARILKHHKDNDK